MTVIAEFVGGPLDGEIHVLPDGYNEWRVPGPPRVGFFAQEHPGDGPVMIESLIYRRGDRRIWPPSATGEPVYKFELVR